MEQKAFKDTPLAEIVLRRYEKPYSLSHRELVRKYCLSIGLLQPGDSRDVVVDVMHCLLNAKKERKYLTSEMIREEVVKLRESQNIPLVGVASSNIRRQLKRIRDLMIAEKVNNCYRINEFSKLNDIYEEKLQKFLIPHILTRIREYNKKLDEEF
jgi:hypothetical protein